MPNAKHGLIAGRAGSLLAATDQLDIVVEGRGGHASMPHQTRDPLPVACEIVSAIQALVTRQFDVFDPVVATITKIAAGSAYNVIADSASLCGTLRTLSLRNRAALAEGIEQLAMGIAAAHGMGAKVTVTEGFPVTLCDPRAVEFGAATVAELFGAEHWKTLLSPIMGGEDFSYVLERVPGAMFFIGVAHEGDDWRQCCGIHSTRMMLDESVLPNGAALLAGLGERFLARGFG